MIFSRSLSMHWRCTGADTDHIKWISIDQTGSMDMSFLISVIIKCSVSTDGYIHDTRLFTPQQPTLVFDHIMAAHIW